MNPKYHDPTPLDVFRNRLERLQANKPVHDNYRLVLSFAGGGMAGAVSGSYAAVINELGAAVYDEVLGSSAGALNAAFCVTGEAPRGVTIYPRHLCDGRFLSLKRLFSYSPIMNIDFLIDDVFSHIEPLNYQVLSAANVPFSVTATTRDGVPQLAKLNNLTTQEIESLLKATARIPFVAQGWKTSIHQLVDGCLSQPIPLPQPAPNTKTVVFLNHSIDTTVSANDVLSKVVEILLRAKDPCLAKLFEVRRNALRHASTCLISSDVSVIAPQTDLIQSSEQQPQKIWNGMRNAYRQFSTQLGVSSLPYPALWESFGTSVENDLVCAK